MVSLEEAVYRCRYGPQKNIDLNDYFVFNAYAVYYRC